MLAHEIADAMSPSPIWTLRFSDSTADFRDSGLGASRPENKTESARIAEGSGASEKIALRFQLGNAGLFLRQLHSQSKEFKHLISPQIGIRFSSRRSYSQSAPALEMGTKARSRHCLWGQDSSSILGARG